MNAKANSRTGYRKPTTAARLRPNLALPSEVYRVNRYAYPHSSDADAMRSDWEQIGADFQKSMTQLECETAAD
jgi:hypothetical protein